MIISLMNQKRGLDRFSKLPDDGDPLAPNNVLKPGAKERHRLNPGAPSSYEQHVYKANIQIIGSVGIH